VLDELTAYRAQGLDGSANVRPWLADVAMAVASGARLVVLLAPPAAEVPASYDVQAEIETAAGLLMREGVTVVLLDDVGADVVRPPQARVRTGMAVATDTEEMA
jgi:hypothetical protein